MATFSEEYKTDEISFRRDNVTDIVIVGAGLSGIACARKLLSELKDSENAPTIAILEARERVGGRTLTDKSYGGHPVDIGGQWIGPQQPLIQDIARTLGLELETQSWFRPTIDGHGATENRESAESSIGNLCSGASTGLTPQEELNLAAEIESMEELSSRVFCASDWAGGIFAQDLDSVTTQEYLDSNVRVESVRREIALLVQTVMATDPCQLSFLYFLHYLYTCGGAQQLGDGHGGAQTYKIIGGAQLLSIRMMEEILKDHAGAVTLQLNFPVHKISYVEENGGYFELQSNASDGNTIRQSARRLVLAIPPILWKRVEFVPNLPSSKVVFSESVYNGSAVKCIFVFDSEFWTNEACTPTTKLENLGPIANLFPGKVGDSPALVGLITGKISTSHFLSLSESQKQSILLSQIQEYFRVSILQSSRSDVEAFETQSHENLSPGYFDITCHLIHFVWKSWVDEKYSEGCFASLSPPGILTSVGFQAKLPVFVEYNAGMKPELKQYQLLQASDSLVHPRRMHTIHFTSCELAAKWPGYFEGAVESGYRAASEIIAELNK